MASIRFMSGLASQASQNLDEQLEGNDMHTVNTPDINNAKFPLGEVTITETASGVLDSPAVSEGLRRHASGDWGDIPPEDAASSDLALTDGSRLMSAFGNGERRFWIVTEAGRSSTIVLMPSDY
jgi:hypothetical protein